MAAALKSGFVFSSNHDPIELNLPIWKLQKDRAEEYTEIVNQLHQNTSDFQKLIAAQEVHSMVKSDSKIDASTLMANCCSAHVSFGWLLQMCLNHLPFNSDVVSLLRDLQDSFSPLKLVDSCDMEITEELGSSFDLKISATGVPSPRYYWFKAPIDGSEEWCPLQNAPGPVNSLKICDFESGDAGIYKCYVSHRYPVSTPNGLAPGIYAPEFIVRVKTGSIWIKGIEPKCQKLPIGTPEVLFNCEAVSELSLSYQWFHNDQKLAGQHDHTLRISSLTLEMEGDYVCRVANSSNQVTSEVVHLEAYVPDPKDFQRGNLKFENEEIQIVRQPCYDQSRKAAVGDKISLSCVAVCKHPLVYEWLKQGLRKDLISDRHPWDQFLCVMPVSIGPQLVDIATDVPAPISGWIYQCIVTCPQTGERVKSSEVRVPVSTYSSHERSLPVFKLALIICQEQYECAEYFHPLRAPRNDGQAFIKALQEMNFCVIAFANLSLAEVRDAVDLFCSLIDENCFALFYYNGHALGYGSDIYLVARDSNISKDMVLKDELIWHGEVESRLDACNPLLFVAIYDSCRDNPPEVIAEIVKETRHEPVPINSSFCVGYGTRPSMRNFEKLDKTGIPQGLYMKNLLKHVTSPDLTVSAVFEHLYSSFTREEDSSVVERMKPECKCSTKQLFYLSSPLRRSSVSHQYLRYFKLFRFEAAQDGQQSFDGHFSYRLGICWDKSNLYWVTRDDVMIPSSCENFILLQIHPSQFNNEANLTVYYAPSRFQDLSNIRTNCNFPYGQVSLQIISLNAQIIKGGTIYLEGAHHDVRTIFPPCSKKSGFVESDGPIFPLNTPTDPTELIGRCGLIDLQRVESGPLKFRTLLIYNKTRIVCKGVMAFPVPIVKNFPKMKIKNLLHF